MKLILILMILICCEFLYLIIAKHFNITDKPCERSSHKGIVIRGGGIIFYLSILLYYVLFDISINIYLGGVSLLALVSFIDDIHSLSAKIRLLAQFLSIVLLIFYFHFSDDITLLVSVFMLIVGIGIINSFNFMDGINGMLVGYSIITYLTFLYIDYYVVSFIDSNFLIVCCIGFLLFSVLNFRIKAKCFSGDVGSITIGYTTLYLLLLLIFKTSNFYYLILVLLFGVDVGMSLAHRILRKKNILEPHREQAFQILANDVRIKQTHVALIYMSIQIIINILFLYFRQYQALIFYMSIGVLCFSYLFFIRKYFPIYLNNKIKQEQTQIQSLPIEEN